MARIEKTVFISYRRTDVYTALAVYENLKNQGYDVFFDYRSISSGDFEQIITSNIRARAHFLLILTPTALDRCNEPGDWLRREIEFAIDEKRNIIPLFFKGFKFGVPSVIEKLTGKLKNLKRYNGLNVHEDYFDEAMDRLRSQYLNEPLDTVLHPVSNEVQEVVKEEQNAADKALEQGSGKISSREKELKPKPVARGCLLSWKPVAAISGILVVLAFCIWAGASMWSSLSSPNVPGATDLSQPAASATAKEGTNTTMPVGTNTPSLTNTPISQTPTFELGKGSTMIGKDGMTLIYVPAGEFIMGSEDGFDNEKPVREIYLDAFWIDQTEVTNFMYDKCEQEGVCNPPRSSASSARASYYGNSDYNEFPVIYVSWENAIEYCGWAGRRLPTEAEWEKAARGTDGFIYPWGNSAPGSNLLSFNRNTEDTTQVGFYPTGASPYGALDMAGNVYEWVADWFNPSYYSAVNSPLSNPSGPAMGTSRVLRGGAWYGNESQVRTTDRSKNDPSTTAVDIGFRCAMDVTP